MGSTCSRQQQQQDVVVVERRQCTHNHDPQQTLERNQKTKKKSVSSRKSRRPPTSPGRTRPAEQLSDPMMHTLMLESIQYSITGNYLPNNDKSSCIQQQTHDHVGQESLLYQRKPRNVLGITNTTITCNAQQQQQQPTDVYYAAPTRLHVRRRPLLEDSEFSHKKDDPAYDECDQEGQSGTHIYAVRCPSIPPEQSQQQQQQQQQLVGKDHLIKVPYVSRVVIPNHVDNPTTTTTHDNKGTTTNTATNSHVDHLFDTQILRQPPKHQILDWVTVSDEHDIYVVDVGLSSMDCNRLIQLTEQECKGHYAAYTYAKQTLGCREYPRLAYACQDIVHSVVHSILDFCRTKQNDGTKDDAPLLLLDDREPHMVKYDVTKRERQKLAMHTDKSEWTFIIALSNGCGLDYDGGGTYFECLDATLHVQKGHAVVFPGKLRHCGQGITTGLRFLLVGFLVHQTASGKVAKDSVAALPSTDKEDERA